MGRFFRRGPGRRMMRRAMLGGPVRPEVQREIMRGNQLLASGQPLPAADIFHNLSEKVEQAGALNRASHLAMRAGMAYLDGKAADKSMTPFRRAVSLAILAGAGGQAIHMSRVAVGAMSERGHDKESDELKTGLDAQLNLAGLSMGDRERSPERGKHGTLPAQCPACLAPVRADEVEWIDETSAQCAFCGTTLKAT